MHGEEPAGVEAVLCWLASDRWKSYHWNWLVVPCINPFGWERNRRTNAQRRDINRQFRKDQDDTPEASLIRRLIRKRQFTVSMEFHDEDVDASGFYLYEARRDRAYLGEKVLAAVERVVPINQDPVIDGAERTAVGLIRRDLDGHEARRRRRWPMAYRLYLGHADNIYGSETTISEPLDDRAEAHQIALEVVLGS